MNSIIIYSLVIIIPLLIVMIIFLAINQYKKAHRLIIKDPSKDNHYIKEFLMVEKVDKDTKEIRWRSVFWQPNFECERPPAEAIDVGIKGRKVAQCYRIADNQFCWITDKGIQI